MHQHPQLQLCPPPAAPGRRPAPWRGPGPAPRSAPAGAPGPSPGAGRPSTSATPGSGTALSTRSAAFSSRMPVGRPRSSRTISASRRVVGGGGDAGQLQGAAVGPGGVVALALQRHRVIGRHGVQVGGGGHHRLGPHVLVPAAAQDPPPRRQLARPRRYLGHRLGPGWDVVQVQPLLADCDRQASQSGRGRRSAPAARPGLPGRSPGRPARAAPSSRRSPPTAAIRPPAIATAPARPAVGSIV